MLKLHYEKLTSSFVFKEPLRIINERSILLDNQVKQIENIIKNKKQSEKRKICKTSFKIRYTKSIKNFNKRIFNYRKKKEKL